MESGVYAIVNKENGKLYIGSTKDFKMRKKAHFNKLKSNKHLNGHLQGAFNIHKGENFEFKILKYCKESQLLKWEQYYINYYNSTNRNCGYNLGLRADRQIVSEETRKKISIANKGKKRSLEISEKIRQFQTGKKRSEDQKRKMSKSGKGKIFSDERKRKISIAKKGKKRKPLSEEHKKKISKATKGRIFSEETRAKLK